MFGRHARPRPVIWTVRFRYQFKPGDGQTAVWESGLWVVHGHEQYKATSAASAIFMCRVDYEHLPHFAIIDVLETR